MAEPKPDRTGKTSFAYLSFYVLALGLLGLFVVWITSKMTRTDQADFRALIIGVTLGVATLVLLLSMLGLRRRRRRHGSVEPRDRAG